jgi:hypothetical protein
LLDSSSIIALGTHSENTEAMPTLDSIQIQSRHPTSHSSSTLSTASSGVPGIGYLSGKAVKWTGVNVLKVVGAAETFRRRRFINQLAAEVEALDPDDLANWLVQKEQNLNHAIADILEFSS